MADDTLAAVADESESRKSVAFHAAAEVSALVDMLRREEGEGEFEFVLRGALIRIKALTSVVLSALGDDFGRSTSDMERVVFGEAREVSHV